MKLYIWASGINISNWKVFDTNLFVSLSTFLDKQFFIHDFYDYLSSIKVCTNIRMHNISNPRF